MILTNGKAYLEGKWKTGLDILVEDGKIADIKPEEYKRKGKWLMLRVVILLPVLLIYIYMVPMAPM